MNHCLQHNHTVSFTSYNVHRWCAAQHIPHMYLYLQHNHHATDMSWTHAGGPLVSISSVYNSATANAPSPLQVANYCTTTYNFVIGPT
jgi:hypothetical protein